MIIPERMEELDQAWNESAKWTEEEYLDWFLDLTQEDISTQYYDQLREKLTECNIRWMVPFQGEKYANDTESLTVSDLTLEDVAEKTIRTFLGSPERHGTGLVNIRVGKPLL